MARMGTPTGRTLTERELEDYRFIVDNYNDSVEISDRNLRLLYIVKDLLNKKYSIVNGEYIDVRSGEICKYNDQQQ